ncbi:MAG: hypothetical protein ABIS14_04375 [Sphingomonas sp.]
MRRALGITASVLCLVSQPAFAGEGVARRGDAPLLLRGPDATKPIIGTALSGAFRLRATVQTDKPSFLDDPESRVVRRIASSMFDFYPAGGGSGIHLSGGIRYFDRTNFVLEAQKVTHGLLYSPNWRTASGSRAGFRRIAPTMTAGYTAAISERFMLGVETGAMLGRANIASPVALRHPLTGAGLQERSGLNPMANLVLGLRF